jgi:hypothetical protein
MFYWFLQAVLLLIPISIFLLVDSLLETSAAEAAARLGPAALLGSAAFDQAAQAAAFVAGFFDILKTVAISILGLVLMRLIVFDAEYRTAKAKPVSLPPVVVENLLFFLSGRKIMRRPPVAVENLILFLQDPQKWQKIKHAIGYFLSSRVQPPSGRRRKLDSLPSAKN